LFFGWIKKFGSEKILLGADVKEGKVAIGGWLEKTEINIYDFVKENIAKGIKNIFCTDISKDGKLEGPSTELYKKLIEENEQLNLIASGGVSSLRDLEDLKNINCSGAIVGKAIYEGKISMKDLTRFNN
jgi:phosphoribosylformimino-5-aminoimidazole carboxamide ribotide isomerase